MTMLMHLAETQAHVVMLLALECPREPGQLPGEIGGPGLSGLPGFQTSCLSRVSFSQRPPYPRPGPPDCQVDPVVLSASAAVWVPVSPLTRGKPVLTLRLGDSVPHRVLSSSCWALPETQCFVWFQGGAHPFSFAGSSIDLHFLVFLNSKL